MIHLANLALTSFTCSLLNMRVRVSRPPSPKCFRRGSLSGMIIDCYDMGVTIDISPGQLACKSKRIDIDFCTA